MTGKNEKKKILCIIKESLLLHIYVGEHLIRNSNKNKKKPVDVTFVFQLSNNPCCVESHELILTRWSSSVIPGNRTVILRGPLKPNILVSYNINKRVKKNGCMKQTEHQFDNSSYSNDTLKGCTIKNRRRKKWFWYLRKLSRPYPGVVHPDSFCCRCHTQKTLYQKH